MRNEHQVSFAFHLPYRFLSRPEDGAVASGSRTRGHRVDALSALEGDRVCVAEEAVGDENGVAEGGVSGDIVPVLDGDLAGWAGNAPGAAIFEEFDQGRGAPVPGIM